MVSRNVTWIWSKVGPELKTHCQKLIVCMSEVLRPEQTLHLALTTVLLSVSYFKSEIQPLSVTVVAELTPLLVPSTVLSSDHGSCSHSTAEYRSDNAAYIVISAKGENTA